MPTIDIALAAYNGEKYIAAQIDSILANRIGVAGYSLGSIIVSDNMSSDRTAAIVSKIALRHPQVRLIHNDKPGVISNFNYALAHTTADYVMLSDQDDIWRTDKIKLSLQKLLELEAQAGKASPLLVFTDLTVTDDELNTIHPSFFCLQQVEPERYRHPKNIFLYNVAPGCTMLFNRALLQLAMPVPATAVMHDWWLLLAASTFGQAGHLEQATIYYRQHGGNQVGAKERSFKDRLFSPRQRYRIAVSNLAIAKTQAKAFKERFPQFPERCRQAVDFLTGFDAMSRMQRIRALNARSIEYRSFFGMATLYVLALTQPRLK